MSNYILKYGRDDRVKYISHLDFVRLFHRAVRRADLPFTFSQGFNPHPIMTVAQPLSVGVTSDCEYMSIGFEGEFSPKELTERINSALPPGYFILAAQKVQSKKDIDLTKLDRAVYIVEIECEGDIDIDAFMKNTSLTVMKKTKSGIKESDIRPYIYDINYIKKEDNIITLEMCIAVGGVYNLKCETVVDAMEKYTDGFKCIFMSVHRKSMRCGNIEYLLDVK